MIYIAYIIITLIKDTLGFVIRRTIALVLLRLEVFIVSYYSHRAVVGS
jgi:hypothetical protein